MPEQKAKKFNRREAIILFSLAIIKFILLTNVSILFGKDRTDHKNKPYQRDGGLPSDVVVIYHSRTGNTETMAMEIARRFQTDLIEIKADAYSNDFGGWWNAGRDSWYERPAVIKPEKVDMRKYKLIFLGSPIWLYRPTPPLWTFVKENNFDGKAVVLFNTFNSRFKVEKIHEFQRWLEKMGGRFMAHVYVRRGRWINQMSRDELISEAKKLLDTGENTWRKIIEP
jgi:flavodoxin